MRLVRFEITGLALLVVTCCVLEALAVEDDDTHAFHQGHDASGYESHEPRDSSESQRKDRVLLSDVKTLTFFRNKRTTSRRTHSIHQLSCVGGTAGCKLFTPDSVECQNGGPSIDQKSKVNWRCHAEMSDRVQFNHVEVICEGYDYAEDEHILVGSCGLEFTLDYTDPHDYHHQSYFKHMDEHEKEMHHERVRQQLNSKKSSKSTGIFQQVFVVLGANLILIASFVALVALSFLLMRYFSASGKSETIRSKSRQTLGYGPLTSAVMSTKKAC